MDFESDMHILLRSFSFVGVPFFKQCGNEDSVCWIKTFSQTCGVILKGIFFLLLDFYNLFFFIFFFPTTDFCFVFGSLALTIAGMILRLSVSFKKCQILHLIGCLSNFRRDKNKSYTSLRKKILISWILNMILPILTTLALLVFFIQSFDEFINDFEQQFFPCSGETCCYKKIIVLILNTAYNLHYYLSTMFCIDLLNYVYDCYIAKLKQTLGDIHETLNLDIDSKTIARSSFLISQAFKIFIQIEEVLSLTAFLAYVLVFINFLQIVLANVASILNPYFKFRLFFNFTMATWTIINFMRLTLTGSKIVDNCKMFKHLQMEYVSKFVRLNMPCSSTMYRFLLFVDSSKIKFSFSGYGIFKLNRNLLLAMVSLIITYGVLAVTF